MPYFFLMASDRRFSSALRFVTCQIHLAYLSSLGDRLTSVGPWLDEEERAAGSMLVLDVDEARRIASADPYPRPPSSGPS
jgi:uncharacterized protein YciI